MCDAGMSGRFVGEEIQVETSEEDGMPVSFAWRGRRYRVVEVLRAWQDWGFPLNRALSKQSWRVRRHRNCYIVSSVEARFEIYRERGPKKSWILLKTYVKGESIEHGGVSETGS